MLSPQWLDELRARVTLSSVIMRTTKLQKAGHEWKACCPFHDEKSPSFTVSDQKGFYHCFGCGAHGDVIRWMTDQRGMQFMDAVKELAVEAGMEVPAPDPQAAKRAEQRAGLNDVMEAAQSWFEDNLKSSDGGGARSYLKNRGFRPEIMREFGFGYAPDSKTALHRALSRFDDAMLIESGMRISVDDGAQYDRFRARLMLPIHDARGRVIAFGGRILDSDAKAAKYLNSPDTPLFDKGRTLYNLHRASPASRQTGRVVVVEGYMDVIAMANAGIEDAVAPLGTALTENQIEMLWRMVERPILCFDGDKAGQRAAMKAIARALPILRPSHSLAIARLPQGLDPDDLIKRDGSQAMANVLDSASSLIDTLWEFERDAHPLDTPESKAGLKKRLLDHTDAILDSDIRSLYRKELLQRFSKYAYPNNPNNGWKQKPELSQDSILKYWIANPSARQNHLQRRLGAAIAAGLMLWPDKIYDHSEDLSFIEPSSLDERISIFLEFFAEERRFSRGDILSFMRMNSIKQPTSDEWDDLAFPFTKPQPANASYALASLDQAVSLYYHYPLVCRHIENATGQFSNDADGAYTEQQRLRTQKIQLETELAALLKIAISKEDEVDHNQMAAHA